MQHFCCSSQPTEPKGQQPVKSHASTPFKLHAILFGSVTHNSAQMPVFGPEMNMQHPLLSLHTVFGGHCGVTTHSQVSILQHPLGQFNVDGQ